MKTITFLVLFLSMLLSGCVFIYNAGQGAEFRIDDNDTPDIQAVMPLPLQ
jgi:hypothetical protein